MFDRYTERARRVIFFARYEASQFGSSGIEIGHLLLGLMRENRNIFQRFVPRASIPDIRREIELRMPPGAGKVSTSIDLPLTNECKRVLAYAFEESERLNHRHIGTEHLLLGMLREDHVASEVLRQQGLEIESIREALSRSVIDEGATALPTRVWVPDSATALRIAEAVLIPIVGGEQVEKGRPFGAELRGDTWFVRSTREDGKSGVLSVVIMKDGRIAFAGQSDG
jgi:ATP-dependent Clp protease ATP-binding subunit ClpA